MTCQLPRWPIARLGQLFSLVATQNLQWCCYISAAREPQTTLKLQSDWHTQIPAWGGGSPKVLLEVKVARFFSLVEGEEWGRG